MRTKGQARTSARRVAVPLPRWLGCALAIGAVAVVEAYYGWYRYFTWMPDYDDQGQMLLMLRQWIDGAALYDDVFTQYGPFHILAFGLPFRLLGVEPTIAAGRMVTLALHVSTTVLLAIVVLRLTRSLWSAVLAEFAAFYLLLDLVGGSLHPGALLMFALGAVLVNVVVLRRRWPGPSDVVTGAIAATVLLTKINVGIFLLVALAYVAAAGGKTRLLHRYLLPLTEGALVVMGPVLLLPGARQIGGGSVAIESANDTVVLDWWALAYVAAAVTVILFGRLSRAENEGEALSIPYLAAGFVPTAVAIVTLIVLLGSSPVSVARNVVIRPLGLTDTLVVLAPMSSWALVLLLAVPGLILLAWKLTKAPSTRRWLLTSGVLRVAGALLLLYACLGSLLTRLGSHAVGDVFAYLPLTALVLLPPVGRSAVPDPLGRRFLAVFAVGHSLHAYPVAGLQETFGLLFPLVCAVVVLHDGSGELDAALESGSVSRPTWTVAAPTAAVLLALVWLWIPVLRLFPSRYDAWVPLGLAGTDRIRVPESTREDLARQVGLLRSCSQFVSLPGEPSLHVYAEIEPPTGFNTVQWPTLLEHDEQQAIVDALEATDGPICLKTGPPITRGGTGSDVPGPLTTYLSSGAEFETVASGDDWQIGVRSDR